MEEKKEKKHKGKKIALYFLFVFILLSSISTYLVLTHKVYRIKYLELESDGVLSKNEIIKILDPDEIHKNIIFYRVEDGERKLRKNDKILDCKIEKVFPNTLKIKLREKYVMAYIEKDQKISYINQDGKIQKEYGDVDLSNKNEILIDVSGVSQDASNFIDKDAIDFLHFLRPFDISKNVKKINFENKGNIDIIYKDIKVEFGSIEDFKDKIKILDAIIKDIEKKDEDVKLIYLNKGERPIIEKNDKDKKSN